MPEYEAINRFSLNQLRYFVAVAEHLNFTRAAAECHVAASALSKRIRELELALGVRLFDRSTRSTALTQAGRTLLPRARRLLSDAEAIATMFDEGTSTRRSFRLGIRSLPRDFRAELTDECIAVACSPARVDCRALSSDRQLEELARGRLDLATVWQATTDPRFAQWHVLREPAHALMPIDSAGDLRFVAPRDLAGLRLITTVDPSIFPGSAGGYLARLAGIDFADGDVIEGLLAVLADGNHCAFVPAGHPTNAESLAAARVVRLPLAPNAPLLDTWVTWRVDRDRAGDLAAVLSAVRTRFAAPRLYHSGE